MQTCQKFGMLFIVWD